MTIQLIKFICSYRQIIYVGSTREKESTSPRITEYFKAEEPSVALKEKEEGTDLGEGGVKVSSGTIKGELLHTEVGEGKVEQRDSVELKTQAKVIKNDDTNSLHKPTASESVKTTAKNVTRPLTKTVDKTAKAKMTGNTSKATGRRKRKTTAAGAADGDFAPSSG